MALRSSHGGSVKLNGVVIPHEQSVVDNGSRLDDITQTDSGGANNPCTIYGFVREDNTAEIRVKRDDAAYFEVLGLAVGTIVTVIYFKLGAGNLADALYNSTVERVVNSISPKDKFVEAVCYLKGGWKIPSITIP